ncbi:MAG: cell wall hydrolase SleB, partial [Phenylobacterium sp.]|nr:cell wall hydrolase SleB [Phenylobacterium sp.]
HKAPSLAGPRRDRERDSLSFTSPFAAFRAGSALCGFAALLLIGAAPKPPALSPVAPNAAKLRMLQGLDPAATPKAAPPALLNVSADFAGPAAPFVPAVKTAADRERAVTCLTQAVYYEAALESEDGQAAVAQVVLNRVRHPLFPKSVCAVVFQGASLSTGCQFSFTCDGSMARRPEAWAWTRAKAVAERALNGHVEAEVGTATHYHADYVDPYWAPTVAKITQVGAHIFYRWQGDLGRPEAFQGKYAGTERALGGFTLAALTKPRTIAPKLPDGVETLTGGRVHAVLQAEAQRPQTPRERHQALAAQGQLGAGFLAANYAEPKAIPNMEAYQQAAATEAVAPVATVAATPPAG